MHSYNPESRSTLSPKSRIPALNKPKPNRGSRKPYRGPSVNAMRNFKNRVVLHIWLAPMTEAFYWHSIVKIAVILTHWGWWTTFISRRLRKIVHWQRFPVVTISRIQTREQKKCWTVLDRMFDVVSNTFQHQPTPSYMLHGHHTRWPKDKMLAHPTCWIVQHLSFGHPFIENRASLVRILRDGVPCWKPLKKPRTALKSTTLWCNSSQSLKEFVEWNSERPCVD